MTENFGDIKDEFKQISEALNEMRVQTAVNTDNTDKVLISINSKIDALAEDENTELIKVFLNEMKNGFEEKHRFISAKFSEIEAAYKELTAKAESQLSSDEVKRVFDIIATNLGIFSKDFSAQKSLISEIGVQIEALKQDESSKKEIIRNISLVKSDVEKFSNGFESIILNLNGKFGELNQILLKLDSNDTITEIKKDIENIFMSTNAVLSTLQVIDRKNREFEESISGFITKEDFNQEQEKISKLIAQNTQITDYIDGLPTQSHVSNLTEKVDTAVGVINALKTMLSETGEQNQRMLTAQLESLERKVLNISTEEEFIGFRKELAEFSKEVIKSLTSIREELTSTGKELKFLTEFLGEMDVKETFENFGNLTKESENSVKQSISEAVENLKSEITKNKNHTKTDIANSVDVIDKTIEKTKEELKESSKLNMAGILEHIQGLVNDIFSVKNAIKIDNQENLEAIDNKFVELKEEMISTSNFVVQANHKGAEDIKETISMVSENLLALQEDVLKKADSNSTEIQSSIESLKELHNNFDLKNQEDIEKIIIFFEKLSSELSSTKDSLTEDSQSKFEDLFTRLQKLAHQLQNADAELKESVSTELIGLQNSIAALPQAIMDSQASLEDEKIEILKENSKNIEEIGEKIHNLIKGLLEKNDPFKGEVLYEFSGVKDLLEVIKQEVSQTRSSLDETIKEEIEENLQAVEKLIETTNSKYNSALYGLQNRLSEHLENIKEISQESGLKLDSSLKEAGEIKAEIQSITDKISELQNDSSISELSIEMSKKYEGLLLNLTNLEEIFSSKNEASLQKLLAFIEESFEDITLSFNEQKNSTKAFSQEIVEEIGEKTEALKGQISLIGTDIINTLDTKNSVFLESLTPVNNALNYLCAIDFEQITLDIKNKINSLNYSISVTLKDAIKEENQAQSDVLTNSLSELNEKVDQIFASNSNNLSTNFADLKAFMDELGDSLEENSKALSNSVAKSLNSIETKMLESQQIANENLLDEVSRLTDPSTILSAQDSALATIVDKIAEAREDSNAFFADEINEVANETKTSLLESLKESQEIAKSNIISKITQAQNEGREELIEKLLTEQEKVKTDILDAIEGTDDLATIVDKISEAREDSNAFFADEINEVANETKTSLLESLKESQEGIKTCVIAEITKAQDEGREELIEKLLTEQEKVKTDLLDAIDKADASNEILDAQEELKEGLFEKLEHLKPSQEVLDAQEDLKLEILGKIAESEASSKEAIVEELRQSQSENKSAIVQEIQKAKEETEEALLDELSANLNLVKEVITTIANSKELSEELSLKIENVHSSLQSISSQLDGTVKSAAENYKTSTQSVLNELKTTFYEKVDDSMDELKSFLEVNQEKFDSTEKIDNIKADLFEKIEEISDSVKISVKSLSVKKDLDKLSEELKSSSTEMFDGVQEKLTSLIESGQTGVNDKTEEISRRVEDLKKTISDEITEKIATLEIQSDNQKKDFAENFDDIKTAIADLKESYIDLSINTNMEMSNMLVSAQEKIDDIWAKLEDLNLSDDISDLSDKIANINFDYQFDNLSQKIDNLSFDDKFENLENRINESSAKGLIENSREEFISNFDSIHEKLDQLNSASTAELEESVNQIKEALAPLENLKPEIKQIFADFEEKFFNLKQIEVQNQEPEKPEILESINSFEAFIEPEEVQEPVLEEIFSQEPDVQELFSEQQEVYEEHVLEASQPVDIQPALDALKTELVEHIIEIFTQISFVEEAEDIKTFVDNKINRAKSEIIDFLEEVTFDSDPSENRASRTEGLRTALGSNFEDILSSLDMLHEKTVNVDENCYDIKSEIKEVKEKLKAYSSEDYSYTLQDVETDIAKLRLILKEINETRPELNLGQVDLEKLNEDILSLSTRTNKILLNSDESYSVLQENLGLFRDVLFRIDNTDTIEKMDKRVEKIEELMHSSIKSDKIFNQTFMYLAEWIDKTDEKMAKIEEKMTSVEAIEKSLINMQKSMLKSTDLEMLLDKFSKTFEKQQEKIKSLEEKVEKLGKKQPSAKGSDLKGIVQEVLNMVNLPEFKPDAKLAKKVDGIDKQLTALGKNIEKITSYVD